MGYDSRSPGPAVGQHSAWYRDMGPCGGSVAHHLFAWRSFAFGSSPDSASGRWLGMGAYRSWFRGADRSQQFFDDRLPVVPWAFVPKHSRLTARRYLGHDTSAPGAV